MRKINALQDYMKQQANPVEAGAEDPKLEGYHRDQIFDEEKRSDYLWCLHCERTYKRGEFRLEGKFQMCPYEGCDGSTVLDGIDWERFRDDYSAYPVIPEKSTRYPMYDTGEDDDDEEDDLTSEIT